MKKILLLAGDGIGPEIMAQAEKILVFLREQGLEIEWQSALLGGCAIDKFAKPYPDETKALAQKVDAILLGSVGGYAWDKNPRELRPETGLLQLRADLGLFANLRPAQVLDDLVERSSLKKEYIQGLDLLIVRELTGGIYFGQPRGEKIVNNERVAFNTEIYSESEIRRIAKVAFSAAQKRQKRLCSIDKMNVLESSQLWREIVNDEHKNYPDVELTHMLIDNAAMQLVRNPKQFDVILTGNLFGDILSDEASMLTGSIGMLPSASLRADKFGLYEPIHGSAPDIAGKNCANPYAMILSLAMMLRYSLDESAWADKVENAVKQAVGQKIISRDIANSEEKFFGTSEIGDNLVKILSFGL